MQTRLIVRADDFGMTHSCNAAVEDCFQKGILTSAAIMAPAPWAQQAAAMSRAHPDWCIGAHLTTLGEWRGYRWRPVLPYDKVSTLVDKHGFLHQAPGDFYANAIDYDQLEREFMAQVELLTNGWGVSLGYVDYHYINGTGKHSHPEYTQVLERVAKAYGVPLSGSAGEKRLPSIFRVALGQKISAFQQAIDALEPGLWYSVHHLLRDDPEGGALVYADSADDMPGGSTAEHRAGEAEVLTDPNIRQRIEARGIRLISYKEI